jgi:hypothetical protein
VTFDVRNAGNTHLKPAGEFVLTDASGVEIDRRSVSMDRFYASTATTLAVSFDHLLAPGDYSASLTLTDPQTGATAEIAQTPVTVPIVEAPAVINADGSTSQPATTNAPVVVEQGQPLMLLIAIAAACLIVGIALTLGVTRLRSSRRGPSAATSDAG